MTTTIDRNNQELTWLYVLKNIQSISERREALNYARRHFMEVCINNIFNIHT